MRELTEKEKTIAYNRYARKHGHFVQTVRANTDLKQKAIAEYHTRLTALSLTLKIGYGEK